MTERAEVPAGVARATMVSVVCDVCMSERWRCRSFIGEQIKFGKRRKGVGFLTFGEILVI